MMSYCATTHRSLCSAAAAAPSDVTCNVSYGTSYFSKIVSVSLVCYFQPCFELMCTRTLRGETRLRPRLVGFQVRGGCIERVRKELASKLEEHDVFVRGCGRRRDEGKGGRTHHSGETRTLSHERMEATVAKVEVAVADVMERLDRVEQSMEGLEGRVDDQVEELHGNMRSTRQS
ncbi:hypothetical protein FNV43_RR06739 [Rhamnella rubrinervis]|uniref:Uncharacterized protein n=1 Tax=Rhamnella rubrinervis TaxID=2594499 RepID=A0A8K0MM93_9ROSA|nr:hypothetical protein FNV43_RR06739 [Rhamnella rubrinervis]